MHRNLKPDNILIDKDGKTILADFAMARMMIRSLADYTPEDPKERDRSGREARRLWYRAPELLLRKATYTQEVDMWSVGCVLAEIATFSVLFEGDSEIEQLFKIFSLLGTPSAYTDTQQLQTSLRLTPLPQWKEVKLTDIFNDPAEIVNILCKSREKSLYKILELKYILGYQGLDLL